MSTKDKAVNEIIKLLGQVSIIDVVVLIIIILFSTATYTNISEWSISGGMDAGNYVVIAYDFINDTDFYEDFGYLDDNYKCPSGYNCYDGIGSPQYLHVYPFLLAIGISIAEGIGPYVIQTIISAATLFIFYLLLRTVFSKKLAILSFLILLTIPLQILYSKEMMSEVLAQFFLFNALLFFYFWYSTKRSIYHYIEILFYILLLLTKIDAILVLVPIGILYTWLSFARKISFKDILPFLSFALISIYYYRFAFSYTNKWALNGSKFPFLIVFLAVFPLTLLLIHFIIKNTPKRIIQRIRKFLSETNIKKIILITTVFILIFLLYRTLPYIQLPIENELIKSIEKHFNNINIIRLSYFVPIPVLITALTGYVIFILREKTTKSIIVFSVFLAFAFTLYSSQHSVPLYWWGRRYLLFGVPLITFLAGYTLYFLYELGRGYRTILLVLLPFIFIPLGQRSLPAIIYKQNEGINKQIYEFSIKIPPDAIVLMPSSWENHRIGSSVASIYDRDIRQYSDISDLDLSSITTEPIYLTDSSLLDDPTVCAVFPVKYSYYYSSEVTCNDGDLLCGWDDAVEKYHIEHDIKLCETTLEELTSIKERAE